MKRRSETRAIEALLAKGSGIGKPSADHDISPELVDYLLADIDLLEAFLTGLISKGGLARLESRKLVSQQFEQVYRDLEGLPNNPEVSQLRRYVNQLKRECDQLFR